jgi:hypothetical protein
VVFVPISEERMSQLSNLDAGEITPFVGEPEVINEPAEPRTVASATEASAAVGFPVAEPVFTEQPTDSTYMVSDRSVVSFQVDVAAVRQILELAGVTDAPIPDALGAGPITADIAPGAMSKYTLSTGTVSLVQSRSPEVRLPEDTDLEQVGYAALRLFGMEPGQATLLAQQIDWGTTLVFPFPANPESFRQVTINGVPGLLVNGSSDTTSAYHLYWQRGDQVYFLNYETTERDVIAVDTVVKIAESVR